jgi:hypothetical protein
MEHHPSRFHDMLLISILRMPHQNFARKQTAVAAVLVYVIPIVHREIQEGSPIAEGRPVHKTYEIRHKT